MTKSYEIQWSGEVISRDPANYPYLLQLLGSEFLSRVNKTSQSALHALEGIASLAGQPESVLRGALESALEQNALGSGSTPHTHDYSLICVLAEALKAEYQAFPFLLKVKGFYRSLTDTNREGLMHLDTEFKTLTQPEPEVVASLLKLLEGEGQFLQLLSHGFSMLTHAQHVIDLASHNGDTRYEHFRDQMDSLTVSAIDNDSNGKCLIKLQNVANAYLARFHVLEQSEEEVAQDSQVAHNTSFHLLARQARQRNVFAQSLTETLTLMCNSLKKAVTLSAGQLSTQDLQIFDPVKLAALVLDTFQMDSQQLLSSFKLAPLGASQNFTAYPLEETALVRELNELLNSIEHDQVSRHAGFTQLMVALATVRVVYPVILKSSPEHFDDLLDQLLPYADIKTAMGQVSEQVTPVLEDFIMRRHQELQALVSLKGKGRAFSADLGL
jgi:hypothetical protein